MGIYGLEKTILTKYSDICYAVHMKHNFSDKIDLPAFTDFRTTTLKSRRPGGSKSPFSLSFIFSLLLAKPSRNNTPS